MTESRYKYTKYPMASRQLNGLLKVYRQRTCSAETPVAYAAPRTPPTPSSLRASASD